MGWCAVGGGWEGWEELIWGDGNGLDGIWSDEIGI